MSYQYTTYIQYPTQSLLLASHSLYTGQHTPFSHPPTHTHTHTHTHILMTGCTPTTAYHGSDGGKEVTSHSKKRVYLIRCCVLSTSVVHQVDCILPLSPSSSFPLYPLNNSSLRLVSISPYIECYSIDYHLMYRRSMYIYIHVTYCYDCH